MRGSGKDDRGHDDRARQARSSVRSRASTGGARPAWRHHHLVYRIEDGSRTYVEQINIRGNVKTQDHVIRREFDLGEGDAYNRALVARAERRLKSLNYFKTVKITTEPGSSPDRVILNVAVEEQNTGEFAIAGGYSTSDGFLGEVRIGRAQPSGHRAGRQGKRAPWRH
jgi:outer membrane protein insertion porin family